MKKYLFLIKHKIKPLITTLALMLCHSLQVHAADPKPPESMTYQGYLVDSNGVPLGNSAPANYDVTFRIYNAKSGGEPIWSEVQTITIDKGYFSVLLGEGSAYANEPYTKQISTVFVGQDISDRFIGITVSGISNGADFEISPRLRLVTSPYSFTATHARNVIDGSGNRNLFKEVDSNNNASLKLGAGSDTTLTLHEGGDTTLAGKLTIDLPTAGVGMEINEQGSSTKFGGLNGDRFSISTARGGFHFDKPIYIDGDLYSFNRDARLYPSNNTDNFLNVNHESDTVEAYTDKFYIKDEGVSYLEINPTSSSLNLNTDANSFYMNKPLDVNGALSADSLSVDGGLTMTGGVTVGGSLSVTGNIMTSGWFGRTSHNNGGLVGSYNNVGGNGTKTNPIYVIGSSYKPAESTLSNMYGVGYTDGSASFITGNASGWGFYVASDGQARTFLSGGGGNSYIGKNGGNLGIGSDNPLDELHIIHAANGNFSKGLRIHRAGGAWWTIGTAHDGDLVFGYNQGDNGTYKAYIARGTGGWNATSDLRLKKDIESSEDVLSKVYKLKPVRYRFKEQDNDAKKSYGFIAQDVQELFPYLVNDEKDYLGLDYGNFGVLSIKAIQELGREKDAEVASLEKKNEQLESRVQSLESELSLVKAQLANKQSTESRIAKLEEIINNIDKGQ